MVDIVITPANVRSQAGGVIIHGTAGASVTAGQLVYRDAADRSFKLADSNVAAADDPVGVALHASLANQPLAVHTSGPINLGATLVAGSAYYLSETAGGIQPVADLGPAENVVQIGLATSTSILDFRLNQPGVILP